MIVLDGRIDVADTRELMTDINKAILMRLIPENVLLFSLVLGVGLGVFVGLASGCGNQSRHEAGEEHRTSDERHASTPAKLSRLQGDGYSIPMPNGTIETPAKVAANVHKMGGKMIMFARKQSGWFAGSVVVIPAQKSPGMESFNDFDDLTKACAEVNALPLNESKTQVVQLPSGRYCQRVGLSPNRENVGSTLTLFKPVGVDVAWAVTCNYDVRDDVAKQGCQTVLNGWQYDPALLSQASPSPAVGSTGSSN